jgi:hypothetical protein
MANLTITDWHNFCACVYMYILVCTSMYVSWHVDSLLGNDRQSNESTAISRQQLCKYATLLKSLLGSGLHATKKVLLRVVFSMWSTPKLYHSTGFSSVSSVEGSEELVRELQFSRCELLLLEAGNRGTGIFREPKVRGTSAIGAVTRQ